MAHILLICTTSGQKLKKRINNSKVEGTQKKEKKKKEKKEKEGMI